MSLAGRPGSRSPADRHRAWLRSLHARCPGTVKWLYSKPGVLSGLPGPQIRVSRSPSQPSAARVKCGLARNRAGAGPRDSPLARVAAHTRRSPAWVPFPNLAAQLRLWPLRPWALAANPPTRETRAIDWPGANRFPLPSRSAQGQSRFPALTLCGGKSAGPGRYLAPFPLDRRPSSFLGTGPVPGPAFLRLRIFRAQVVGCRLDPCMPTAGADPHPRSPQLRASPLNDLGPPPASLRWFALRLTTSSPAPAQTRSPAPRNQRNLPLCGLGPPPASWR